MAAPDRQANSNPEVISRENKAMRSETDPPTVEFGKDVLLGAVTPANPKPSPASAPRLRAPVRITDQSWPESTRPVVSIVCNTYNHESFIRQCIEGFLIQETTFPVEILIHEDASTDATASIVREFEQAEPVLIKPIYQQENQYSKSVPINVALNFPRAQGCYIALCEGDDHWTDPEKLERQVHFLDCNPDYVLIAENSTWYDMAKSTKHPFSLLPSRDIGILEILQQRQFATASVMFRNLGARLKPLRGSGDTILWCHLSNVGKVRYENIISSVYHRHPGGITGTEKIAWARKMIEWNDNLMHNHPEINENIFIFRNHDNFCAAISPLIENGQYEEALEAIDELTAATWKPQNHRKQMYGFVGQLLQAKDRCIEQEKKRSADLQASLSFRVGRALTRPLRLARNLKHLPRQVALQLLPKATRNKALLKERGVVFINKREIIRASRRLTPLPPADPKRQPQVIVSLTSFPPRINDAFYAICSLLNQRLRPDRLILWLAETQFPKKEGDLPRRLLSLERLGLEIRWCEDLKSYKKLIPTLRNFPDAVIVTADDDLYYPEDWLERLYSAYLAYPDSIHCHRAHRINVNENGEVGSYATWPKEISKMAPSALNFPTGGAGALYPPGALHSDVLRKELFMELCPTADDIWFWAMSVLKGSQVRVVDNNISSLVYIDPEQEYRLKDTPTLSRVNVLNNGNDIQMNRLLDYYEPTCSIRKRLGAAAT